MDAERADQQRNAKVGTLLSEGDQAFIIGERRLAHERLREAATLDPYNENVWLGLLKVLDIEDDRIVCLENVIAINPLNVEARRLLRHERGLPDLPPAPPPMTTPSVVIVEKPNKSVPLSPLPVSAERPLMIFARALLIGIGLGLLGVVGGIIASILYWNVTWPF